MGAAGTSNTSALVFGGGPPSTGNTEEWNGSSWAEVANLSVARRQLGGAGTVDAALAFGGDVPPNSASTEEWSSSSNVVKTLTD